MLIGGSFLQVGGGQANPDVCNFLDEELYFGGILDSFADPNLWVEPKTRDGVRNRTGFARLIGGSTPGPGNIGLNQTSYSQDKSISTLPVALVRTNGTLGPASANFSVQPQLALAGQDYKYQAAPPLYWIAWNYLHLQSRMREDGLWGVSGNGLLVDALGASLSQADSAVNSLAKVTVGIIANSANPGDLRAQFQLANPSLDTFYLGGEEIPLGTALGVSSAPLKLIDDTTKPGQFGFSSSSYIAVTTNPPSLISISVVRSNGTFGIVSMKYSATNGTAIAGSDYRGITNANLVFNTGIANTNFTVTVLNNGATTNVEKTVNLKLSNLGTTPGATFGISNAVMRIINPNFQGFVTLAATNFTGTIGSSYLNFVVNRVSGSWGSVKVYFATTNGSAIDGVDYLGTTNFGTTNYFTWNDGDVSQKTISIPLKQTGIVGTNRQFGVYLFSPLWNNATNLSLMGIISNATLTISNDNSYGTLQFSAPSNLVSESGGYATLTVTRMGGTAGQVSVNYATSDGTALANTDHAGVSNYVNTAGTLVFAAGQIATNIVVPVLHDYIDDPTPFYFNVTLSNPTNAMLGSPSTSVVNIFDVDATNWPPGSPDQNFTFDGVNGSVQALALNSSGQILAGGAFTDVGTTARGGRAAEHRRLAGHRLFERAGRRERGGQRH